MVTAVLTQEVKELDDVSDLRVIEVIEREKRSFNVGGKEFTAGQLVEQLGFTNEKQWTPVKDLSGGERRRLQLLRLLVGEPNVLMLDEPTNDLDTDTLAAVEDVLDGWPGTLVVVSHDRYLLERVTDHQMALLGDGKIRALPRGVDQYLELREAAMAGSTITGGGNPVTAASGRSAPAVAGPSEAEKRDARKAKNRIDRQLGKLKQQEDKIHAQMTAAAADPSAVGQLAGLNKRSSRTSRSNAKPSNSNGWEPWKSSANRPSSLADVLVGLGAGAGPSASLRHRAKGTLRSLGDLRVPMPCDALLSEGPPPARGASPYRCGTVRIRRPSANAIVGACPDGPVA